MLDLICKRYPGTKPSDYVEGLDSYEAFQLDAALALRYSMEDADFQLDLVDALHSSIRNVVQALSSKKLPKARKRPRLTKSKDEDEMMSLNEVRQSLTGGKTVVVKVDGR